MSQLELQDHEDTAVHTFFVDLILPLPIPNLFTYRLPRDLNDHVQVGSRVIVPFGSRRILTGVVHHVHDTPPKKYEARYVLELLDDEPVIRPQQIELFEWMADYYMCTIGEVLNVALPSGLKLSSESKVQLHPDFNLDQSPYPFSDNELEVVQALRTRDTLSYSDIHKFLGLKSIYNLLKSLTQKGAIIIFEEVKERYKPKKVKQVRLAAAYRDEENLHELLDSLANKAKQEEIMLHYLQRVSMAKLKKGEDIALDKSEFKSFSPSSLKTLTKNNIFEELEVNVSRFESVAPTVESITLSKNQEHTKEAITNHFKEKDYVLLHGITGSGKTAIYISLIQDLLETGSQVLYLLPEIALTTQIVTRLKRVFGDKMGVYHSKFSDNERVEVWNGVLSGKYQVVVGVRSAVFLPFDHLGLIIADEEHEPSYKQFEPAPRYHARDVAMMLTKKHYSKMLLGSATPALETYYLAQQGQYGLVTLSERYGTSELPNFKIANMVKERKQKTLKGEFSSVLLEELTTTLDRGEQAIIFQNRRGYAPYLTCLQCGWIPKCIRCAVSLTYHQYRSELRCHYCGYHEPLYKQCDACGSKEIRTKGFGTEKLEEDLTLLFPSARIQRMDLDTTRSKNSYERILTDFENEKIDILVGTQMVSKGLDFDHVTLVGVIDLDRMLHFPDFRSYERTFSLTSQVSGRAGRKHKKGLVVIQTHDPDQEILSSIKTHDYEACYNREIKERNQYGYPPFTRLIKITLKHEEQDKVTRSAMELGLTLTTQLGKKRVLGPQEPLINKIRNEYLSEIWIKLERDKTALSKVKELLHHATDDVLQKKEFKGLRIIHDVDPY